MKCAKFRVKEITNDLKENFNLKKACGNDIIIGEILKNRCQLIDNTFSQRDVILEEFFYKSSIRFYVNHAQVCL